MLAAAGKFPDADYENVLHKDDAERAAALPADGPEFKANLGRIPFIRTPEGAVIGQSMAIYNYVAATTGFLGSSPAETAKIVSFVEHCKEVKAAWRALAGWGPVSDETVAKWHNADTPSTDFSGPSVRATASTRVLPWWARRIEADLPGGGFAVGGKLSLADFELYNTFGESMNDKEPFGDKAKTAALLAAHAPKLAAVVATVAANEGVQKWIAVRGPQQW